MPDKGKSKSGSTKKGDKKGEKKKDKKKWWKNTTCSLTICCIFYKD